MDENQDERLLNAYEVASYLRVNINTVRTWALTGRMPAINCGRKAGYRFHLADVEKGPQKPIKGTK